MKGTKVASLSSNLMVAKGLATPAVSPTGMAGKTRLAAAPMNRAAPTKTPGSSRVRLSIRLDPARYFRMKVAMAHLQQNGQELLLAALDHYLDRVVPTILRDACACLALSTADAVPRDRAFQPCPRHTAPGP